MKKRRKNLTNMKRSTSRMGGGAWNRNVGQKPGMGIHIANRTRSAYKARCRNYSAGLHAKEIIDIDFNINDDVDVPTKSVISSLQSGRSDVVDTRKVGRTKGRQLAENRERVLSRKRPLLEDVETDQPRKRQRLKCGKSDDFHGKRKKQGRPPKIKTDYVQNEQPKKIEGELRRVGRPRKNGRGCRGRPRRRILDREAKRVHRKPTERLKKHGQYMVFDDEVRKYIKKMVRMEVKKQMVKFRKLETREKWGKKLSETGKKKGGLQKSRMDEFNTDGGTEEKEIPHDVEGNDHLIDINIEEKENLVIEINEEDTGKQSGNSGTENNVNGVVKTNKRSMDSGDIQKEAQIPLKHEDFPGNHEVQNLKGRSEENADLEAMWKDMEQALKGDMLNSGSKTDSGVNLRNRFLKGNGAAERQGLFPKRGPSKFLKDKQIKESGYHVGSENVAKVGSQKNVNGIVKGKKRSRASVLATENVDSPFQRLLLDIQKESQIPSNIKGGFQNHEEVNVKDKSEQTADLEAMWKDMELALKGDQLNSASMMSSKYPEHSFQAESNMYDMGCVGDHEFILNEEIGIICRVCKVVKQEIDAILPSLIVDSGKKQSRESWGEVEDSSQQRTLHFPDHRVSSSSNYHCPTKQSVWDLIPDLKQKMYIHQQEGFEFLWKNLGGGLIPGKMKSPTSEKVGGCIISHAPGTGKTFLIISFLRTYLELFPRSRTLIVAPNSMLLPWQREFEKWNIDIPLYILNRTKNFWKERFADDEDSEIVQLVKSGKLEGKRNKNLRRLVMLHEWHKKTSVLAVGYNLFVYLTCDENLILPEEARHVGKLLLESPGMLILDEGHQARNNYSKIWQALRKVNTKLRIILSGTLFQNNFTELFNTLYLVRPTFADRCLGESSQNSLISGMVMDKTEFQGMTPKEKESRLRRVFMDEIGNKIQSGKEEFDQCLEKFRSMTDDFVHCYEGKVLSSLPGLRDFTVKLRPSAIQRTILENINKANNLQRINGFEFEIMVSSISIHPSLYNDYDFQQIPSSIDAPDLEAIRDDPNHGVKTKFVLDLMQLCQVMQEKVLLFSQNIPPLILLSKMFETHFSWRKGKEILQLDGTLPLDERQGIIDRFNDPCGEAHVLFASIRTCSEGITLIGASRVVFLDLVWNPAIVKQAVSRAFRLGQKKLVYVYRLIASGTMEEEKYQRTVWKDCLSKLIFISTDHGGPNASENTQKIHCEDKILDKLVELDRETKMFHTIFEHSELRGRKDLRSGCFHDCHNLNEGPMCLPK